MAKTAFRLEIFKNQPKKRVSYSSMTIRANSSNILGLQALGAAVSILLFLLAGVSAQAAVRSASFVVSAMVEDSCTVQSSPYISIVYMDKATSDVSVQCARGSSYRLTMQSASSAEFASFANGHSASVPQPLQTAPRPIRETGYSPAATTSEAQSTESLLLTVEY